MIYIILPKIKMYYDYFPFASLGAKGMVQWDQILVVGSLTT